MTTQTKAKEQVDEDPRKKFERLAESRVTKALTAVALVEQLANPQRYSYTETDIDAIESALDAAAEKCIMALRQGKVQAAHFSLSTNGNSETEGE